MKGFQRVARTFGMSDEAWRRHANPWSVYTRFAAIPAMLLAIWSRTWIGWWALLPVAVVAGWLWVNPHAFAPVSLPRSWAAKGIYGEQLWLNEKAKVPASYRGILRLLVGVGSVGFVLVIWGLVQLLVWPTVFGATLVVMAQLWRIDRMGQLYDESLRTTGTAAPAG